MQNFDLIVIGAGSAGVRAARTAANLGAKVAVIEAGKLGGTCVNVGCVPKKLYSYAAHYSADFVDSRGFGWEVEAPVFSWATLRDNKTREIARLNDIYARLLQQAQVTQVHGNATIVTPQTVRVGQQEYRGGHILICTGGHPQLLDFPGSELSVTSDDIFDLPEFPERILILGAGYIGVEFAGIFAGLGAKTWLSYRGDKPLRDFDEDLRRHFVHETGKHMQLLPGSQIRQLERGAGGGLRAVFQDDSVVEVDVVLSATGRLPNTRGLGLENTRVKLGDKGVIEVDAHFQTAEPTIYAIGDVVGRMALTPVALAEAMVVADRLFGKRQRTLSYQNIATAVFSHPNLATVGLTEAQAREQYPEVAVYEADFRHLKHTLSGRDERTYMKVLVDPASDRVVGMHMMGADAGELIQGFATAMTCNLTKAQLDATIGIHPTAAEEFVTLRTRTR